MTEGFEFYFSSTRRSIFYQDWHTCREICEDVEFCHPERSRRVHLHISTSLNVTKRFTTIYSNNGLQPIVHKVQIFDMLGLEVAQTPSFVITGNSGGNSTQTWASELLRIDVSHLPAGVYFVKIGNRVEKFVKM